MHSSRTLVAAVALSAITVFAGAGSAVAAPVGSVRFRFVERIRIRNRFG